MTEDIKVGDLVISRSTIAPRAKVGRPALVIDATLNLGGRQHIRLKVGETEWWDISRWCEKVPE